jgi:PAS domain S-box-containing protein
MHGGAAIDWFTHLAAAAPTPMWVIDSTGATVYVNPAWLALTGRALPADGRAWSEVLHPEDRPRVLADIATALATRSSMQLTFRVRRADGAYRWFDSISTPRSSESGEFQGYVGLCFDVTDRHDAAAAVQHYHRAAIESGQILFTWKVDEDRLSFPQEITTVFGHPVDRLKTLQAWLKYVDARDRQRLSTDIERGTRSATAFATEYRFVSADGDVIPVRGQGALVRDARGELVSIAGFLVDQRGERQARRLAETHAAILANLSEGVTVSDDGGKILYANQAMEQMFGYAAGELAGRNIGDLNADPPARKAEILADMLATSTAAGRWVGEVNSIRKDGHRFISRATVAPFVQEGHRWWVIVRRDISERKRLEAAVAASGQLEQERIAAELHDGLGQELAGLSFALGAFRNEMARHYPAGLPRVDALADVLKGAIALCRTTAQDIAAFGLSNGLDNALRLLAVRKQRLYGLHCDLDIDPALADRVPPAAAHHLYRIAQESLRNACRHGHATHCRIVLRQELDVAELLIRDDGDGFDPAADHRDDRMGLRVMRYRAEQLGGTLAIDAARGRGTTVRCRFTT